MGFGLLMIPALLVKSFVLAAPVGLWLFLMWWLIDRQTFWQSGWLSSLTVALGLAGFSLWFVMDPNPAAVWREFVMGENFSTKFSESRSDSLWTLVWAPFLNAGLLAPLVVGLCWVAARDLWQRYRQLGVSQNKGSPPERWVLGLWLWIAVWLLVFALPSQRSARYVIPVMPAVAVLLALYAPRIGRVWWILTLSFLALAAAGMAWIAYALSSVVAYSALYGVGFAGLLVLCVAGIVIRQYQKIITAAASVATLALLGALAIPFDGEAGRYPANAIQTLVNKTVWVPQNFNAQFQKYSFILPGAKLAPYDVKVGLPRNTPTQSDAQFVVQFDAMDDTSDGSAAARLAGASDRSVKVLASRWVLRGRHAPGEVTFQKLGTVQGVQALLVEQEFLLALE
jgi:hypothetical protein